MSSECGECYSCESGDTAMCYGCPVHGAWCDWFGEGPKCLPENSSESC